ncbi:MAG: hypothetical protein KOO63_13670 [Bacteroidales bacterium]|nr:hypothetical protein [Candidatus Latescibacterota bacterium]
MLISVYYLKRIIVIVLGLSLLGCFSGGQAVAGGFTSPEEFFGFKPGADGELFDYDQLIEYLGLLDQASPMMEMREIGISPMGRTIFVVFISSEENIGRLDELKIINKRLALEQDIPQSELEQMIDDGRVFFVATLSMHSSEVGPSQSAPLIAYDLVTTDISSKIKSLDEVVYMFVPCHNPDGMDMVVHHYMEYKGTRFEGSRMPGIYHKYVGHDNNRDFVTLTQMDTKAVSRLFSHEWFPQVMVEKHQMGSSGVRYFVPPNHDPIAQNIDASLWNWIGIFGSNLMKDMTADGCSGVTRQYLFDDYWPGSTETCIWKNVIGFLTESASAQYAKPVYVEPGELRVHGKGLSEYKKGTNMPQPWEGGWWRLSDIVDYEISSTMSIIRTASNHRKDILRFRNNICQIEVEKGKTEPPFYFVMPSGIERQRDLGELCHIVDLLKEHGVKVYETKDDILTGEGTIIQRGDIVVPLAQPFRAFIKEVMERQQFPVRHYTPGGEIIKPYDITSWSLPLHRGVTSFRIDKREPGIETSMSEIEGRFRIDGLYSRPEDQNIRHVLLNVRYNESFKAVFKAAERGLSVFRLDEDFEAGPAVFEKGSFLVSGNGEKLALLNDGLSVQPLCLTGEDMIPGEDSLTKLTIPRTGLVETFRHDMDAGWTRYLLDDYGIPFKVLRPGELEDRDLAGKFDVILIPDTDESVLMTGKYKSGERYYSSGYPPGYTKGMGKKGKEKLLRFIDSGGTVLAWGRSAGLFSGELALSEEKDNGDEFTLPFNDISKRLKEKGLYCPGSLVRIDLATDHLLSLGMGKKVNVFFRGRPVFATSIPAFDMDRRVVGRIPESDILVSGYAEKLEEAGGHAALVWFRKNKGQLVLYGFNPQFRASTAGCYKLLLNGLLLPDPSVE